MSKNIVEELPARKHAPVAAPVAKKEGQKSSGGSGGNPEEKKGDKPGAQKGGSSEEASAKRIRQAVYDIRYRARREDIDLKAAFSQYMSNSNLSAKERAAVSAKLFGKEGGGGMKEEFTKNSDQWATDGLANALYKVFVEQEDSDFELAYVQQLDEEDTKYKVRVTDKNGNQYVRFANRTKITELRQNSNIKSVEMTEHGDVVGGEKRKGRQTAKAKRGLDPVGKEDKDIDNDGDHDKNDKYLLKRRKAIGNSIRKRADQKIKEAYGATGTTSVEGKGKKIKEDSTIDNSKIVKVNPSDGQQDPAIKPRGVYAHLQLLGDNLSESQKKLLKMVSEKKEEEKKKNEVASVMTKDKVEDPCAPEEGEEKKDMRGTYAKLNIIKNKLRAAGQRNPMVMVDDIEEGAYETVKNVLDKGSKFIKKNPVGKVLGKIVEPVKGNKGRGTVTKAENQANIDKNKK